MVSRDSFARSVVGLTGLSIVNSILALAADVLVTAKFGVGHRADAYFAALTIPSILGTTLPAAAATAFVPVYYRLRQESGEAAAWRMAGALFNNIALILGASTLLLIVFADQVIDLAMPGFVGETRLLTVTMFRWMLAGATFSGLGAVLASFHNSNNRFRLPAYMPVLQNAVIILFLLCFAGNLDILAMAAAVAVGWVLQFLCLFPYLIAEGGVARTLGWNEPHIRGTVKHAGLMILGGLVTSAFLLSDRYFASAFPPGGISSLTYGSKVGMLASNLISVSLGTVLFPRLARLNAEGNTERFRVDLIVVVKTTILILVPFLGWMIALREPLLSLAFERKAFTHEAVVNTGWAMVSYLGVYLAYAIGRPLSAALYSLQDTSTPLKISIVSLALYVILTYVFCRIFDFSFLGLGVAASLVHFGNLIAYMKCLAKKIPGLDWTECHRYFMKLGVISLLIGACCTILITNASLLARLAWPVELRNLAAIVVGIFVWGGAILLLFLTGDPLTKELAVRLRGASASLTR